MTRVLEPHEELGACGLVANLSQCDGVDDTFDDLPFEDRERAYEMARVALGYLTARVVANCPVSVRPCSAEAMGAYPWRWSGLTYIPPTDLLGQWVPGCGCAYSCACDPKGALDLNGPVAEIISVEIDGTPLEETDYWLSERRYLIRKDGTWPRTQDMSKEPGETGTFVVTYRPGYPLGLAGEIAYGVLATEVAKAMCDKDCRLPANVKTIVRRGVTIEFGEGLFPENRTGIRDVDLFVGSVNPTGKLRWVPTVATPETQRRRHRVV